ncbi:GTP 3',8-cyclase MoaA [Clostridium felsineum]|uniref:GTP 3',8-cyclase MoaA n=1 Tax=Clostridium felsineum TaxID=36839 RepID=UPI00214DCF86|nr:GTP 3',8-cyclase MoaA [Clostridium felsineum]MCR3760465.1 GTP 3',8-cyclase MoaA [Clostridium felsineum]
MLDSYGRKINYLRVSVTDNCNLNCKYCRPYTISNKKNNNITLEEICTIVKGFVKTGVDKVRITGGEPLVRNDILTIVEKIHEIDGIKDLAMTTNGLLLSKYAKDLKSAGLNRVNISLDTLDSKKYFEITKGGSLKMVLKGIEAAKKAGLSPIKLNVVLMKNFNEEDIIRFINLTKYEDIDVRFIELMPIGTLKDWSLSKYLNNHIVFKKVPNLIEVAPLDISSPAKYYSLPSAKGRIGLINPISCKFCSNCNRIRLTADGKLKPCLHSNTEFDIRKLILAGKNIDDFIQDIIINKPKEHYLEDGRYIYRQMSEIGG